MAGEYDDAILRTDALIATVHLNSVCYEVQVRTYTLPHGKYYNLTFSAGIYASSPWDLAYGEQQLRGCDTIVRACASPTARLHESSALGDLAGKLPNGYITPYRKWSPSLTDIWMDI